MNHPTYPNFKQSLLLLIFFFTSGALYFFLAGFMPQLFGYQLPVVYISTIIAIAPIAYLPLIIYVSRKSGIQLKWPVKLPGIQIIFLLALLAVFAKIITSPLNKPNEYIDNLIDERLKMVVFDITKIDLNMVIKFVGSVLIVPLFEEIFFRKQLLGILLKKYTPFFAIVLSSIFFAVVHLRFNDIGSLFIMGLLFGIVYYQTNLIEVSILFHSFGNIYVFITEKEFIDITGLLLFKYVSVMTVSIIGIVLIIKYLGRYRTMNKLNDPETAKVS